MIGRAQNRFSLALLMGFIGAIAVGLGGMRLGSDLAEKVTFNLALLALLVGLLGAIVRRGEGAWVGFALFGWCHALLAFVPAAATHQDPLIASVLVRLVAARLHPGPGPAPTAPTFPSGYVFKLHDVERSITALADFEFPDLNKILSVDERKTLAAHMDRIHAHEKANRSWGETLAHAEAIGQTLFALIFALAGAALGRTLARREVAPRIRPADGGSPDLRGVPDHVHR